MKFQASLKAIVLALVCTIGLSYNAQAQCPELAQDNRSPQPGLCQQAPSRSNLVPYFNQCRTICFDNTGVGASNQTADVSCFGGSQPNNDLFLYAENPYAQISGYDGSLVFRWVDWPGKAAGVANPYFAVHGEVTATFAGITAQSIDCTDGFALENAICVDTAEGNQFFAPPNTIPTLAQITPLVRQIAGVNVNVTNIAFWIQIATRDGGQGPICLEVSPYESGFLCGDATDITLTGSGSTRTGTAPQICLCASALYGGIGNVNNGFTPPCGIESESSAWYKITAPFGCNSITATVNGWGGTDDYNIAIIKDLSCPGDAGTNPITGDPAFLPGQTIQPGASIVGSGCSAPAVTGCNPVPAGEYYIVVSGKTERPTFSLSVTVNDISAAEGTASSPQNNDTICSEGTIVVSTSGSTLPLSADCGQDIAWYYSTNLAFNPYNGQGTYLGSGTSNVSLQMPANTACTPRNYYIKGIISDDGISPTAGCGGITNRITVTVMPELGTITVNRGQCIITVATRCSNFSVNGNPGVDNYIASFADDGTVQDFLVSNGFAACNVIVSDTVSCSGNCTQPTANGTAVCDPNDPFNFYVDVSFAPGSAATYFITDSDGGAVAVSVAGTYRVGPYSNGSNIFISLENNDDANCNIPIGSFTADCNNIVCPNLVSASTTVTGDACEGSQTILQATVDQGQVNVDYSIQWYKDGVPIPGATQPSVIHTFSTSQGCSEEAQEFVAKIKCLDPNGSPTVVSELSAGIIVVYPIPQLGRDFVQDPDTCQVAPIDLCGGLNITYSPVNNPAPGAAPLTVNYTVRVPGAPAGCEATGSYVVNCPICGQTAGTSNQPTDDTYCFGESFDISTGGADIDTGFALVWAVNTNSPYNDLNAAVSSAISAGNFFGNDITGNQSYTFVNGTDYGPGDFYFTPFVALQDIDSTVVAYQVSGTLNAPFGSTVTGGVSRTLTIPELPYCQGLLTYNVTFSANRTSGIGSPIDNVTGILNKPSGGSVSNINLQNNNFTANPSGETLTLTVSSGFGADVSYTLTVRYNRSVTFPTLCPTCTDIGTPIALNLLPDINLQAINPPTVCDGEVFDLTTLNPSANIIGTYTWYDGVPGGGGSVISRPDSIVISGTATYYVDFAATDDTTCTQFTSVTLSPTAKPSLNAIPAQPALCFGETVDLTALESGITTAPGSFQWYKGDPDANGIRLPASFASNLSPVNGVTYFAVFTSLATGCDNKTGVTYTVNPIPPLNSVPRQKFCNNAASFDLGTLDTAYTQAAGTFTWYFGDPDTGATALTNLVVTPDSGDVYFVVFVDQASGCSAKGNVGFDINPSPIVMAPNLGTICQGDVLDLISFQTSMTTDPGSFVWYDGDPNTTGVQLTNTQAQNQVPVSGDEYYVTFTNAITQCSATINFTVNVSPKPQFNNIPSPESCDGDVFDLSSLESSLIAGFSGSFEWYNGDPDTGATLLTPAQVTNQIPTGAETYFVVFADGSTGCSDTTSFSFTIDPNPVLNAIPAQSTLCAGSVFDLTSLEAGITTDAGTFAWFDTALIAGPSMVMPITGTVYTAEFTDAITGCTDTVQITFDVADTISGITASYNCITDQLVLNLTGGVGGSGGGYAVAANSPNNAGDVLLPGDLWTIYIEDSIGCRDTLTGDVPCIICEAGDAVAPTDNVLCCGDTLRIANTGATLDINRIVAWGLTPFADGPVTNEAEAFAAYKNYRGNADGSFTLRNDCGLAGGRYYATPYISIKPNDPDPIVYDTLAGCRPTAEICPTISGTGWVLNPMILTFPDGSTYNVNQELAFGLPIDQALLDAVTGGVLPCLDLTSIYPGDPNGTWTVSITNTGSGDLSFSVPAFNVIVDSDSCSLITSDQVFSVSATNGTITAGNSSSIDIVLPPVTATAPPITYDTLAGCRPFAEICPTISGNGWVLDPMVITFPDGSTYNVNQELAFGLPIDQALLDAVTGGSLPCLNLSDLYAGDPNGTWTISITNTGTGAINFSVPPFNIVVESDTCSLLTQDEIVQMGAVSGTIQPNQTDAVNLNIPPPAVNFPAIDTLCEDYGAPVELLILNPIGYASADIVCTDTAAEVYTITITGVTGGAPEFVSGAEYTFSQTATYDAATDVYTITVSSPTFPLDITVSNSVASVGGGNCPTVVSFEDDPCLVNGVEPTDAIAALQIFPNPSEGKFVVETQMTQAAEVEIIVMNLLGEVVKEQRGFAAVGIFNATVDLTEYANGVYLIGVRSAGSSVVKRVVKQ